MPALQDMRWGAAHAPAEGDIAAGETAGSLLWSAPARHRRDGAFPKEPESGVALRLPPQSIGRAVKQQRGAPTSGGAAHGQREVAKALGILATAPNLKPQ